MRRCQLVQELLWYLVYGFEQEKKDCQSDEPGSVVKEGDAELTLDQDNLVSSSVEMNTEIVLGHDEIKLHHINIHHTLTYITPYQVYSCFKRFSKSS